MLSIRIDNVKKIEMRCCMRVLKLFVFICAAFIIAILTGCASPANYQSMIVKPFAEINQNPKLKKSIIVSNVTGGKSTNPLWVSQVDNNAIRQALEHSLSAYGYLATEGYSPKYKLNVNLLKLDQPFGLLDIKIVSHIEYQLADKKYHIAADGFATVSDKFCGNTRLKVAIERSIQENIKKFLRSLSSF